MFGLVHQILNNVLPDLINLNKAFICAFVKGEITSHLLSVYIKWRHRCINYKLGFLEAA